MASRASISFQDLARQLQQTADVLQQTLDEKLVAEQQRDAGSKQLAELLRSQTAMQQQLDHTQKAYNAALRTLKEEQTKRKDAESLLQQATKQVGSLQLDLKSAMANADSMQWQLIRRKERLRLEKENSKALKLERDALRQQVQSMSREQERSFTAATYAAQEAERWVNEFAEHTRKTQEQQRAVDEAEAALAVDRVEHLLERSKAERRNVFPPQSAADLARKQPEAVWNHLAAVVEADLPGPPAAPLDRFIQPQSK